MFEFSGQLLWRPRERHLQFVNNFDIRWTMSREEKMCDEKRTVTSGLTGDRWKKIPNHWHLALQNGIQNLPRINETSRKNRRSGRRDNKANEAEILQELTSGSRLKPLPPDREKETLDEPCVRCNRYDYIRWQEQGGLLASEHKVEINRWKAEKES